MVLYTAYLDVDGGSCVGSETRRVVLGYRESMRWQPGKDFRENSSDMMRTFNSFR